MGAVKKEIIASADKKIPKSEWISLTDKEIHNLWMWESTATDPVSFSRIIEAKLKELNK
jgi:hypothetical protein